MSQHVERSMIIIYGATGVGKSAFALELGKSLPIEIVNGDMGQFYLPLTIGTAKPAWQQEPIPHHLFDIIAQPEDFTVVAYREAVLATLEGIWRRGNIPVIVGGSGFYLHALLFPPQAHSVHNKSGEVADEEISWDLLQKIDPDRARAISPNDTYRIARALSIWRTTGVKPSSLQRPYQPPAPFLLVNITRERENLYDIINQRTLAMIEYGWIREVEEFAGTPWEQFIRRKKLIGYTELFDYLAGRISLDETIALIQQKTRNYAKRQQTFWNMFDRQVAEALYQHPLTPAQISTVNLTFVEARLYINQLIEDFRQLCG